MADGKEKKVKKVSVILRAKAYKYIMPYYTETELLQMVKSTPAIAEREVINIIWGSKKEYSREENMYKDWCNGMDYPALQKKYYNNYHRIQNTLNDVRQAIINEIFERFAGERYGGAHETETKQAHRKTPKKSETQLFKDYLKLCKEIREAVE